MLECFPCVYWLGESFPQIKKPRVALLGTSLLLILHYLAAFHFDTLEELHAAATKTYALCLYVKVLKRKVRADISVYGCAIGKMAGHRIPGENYSETLLSREFTFQL